MPVFLDEIIAATRTRVDERKRGSNLRELELAAERHSPRGFRNALVRVSGERTAIIAELKKASPSKGLLRPCLDVAQISRDYEQAGAAALSVLTEEQYFQGSLENLRIASDSARIPALRKDFIIDEFQLIEARANGADAVLLIAAALSDAELERLYESTRALALDVLCEVHDEAELARAVGLGFNMIGVNARDLRSFNVDLNTSLRLAAKIPDGILKVAESGIHSGDDISRLRSGGYDAFLIGEAFMRSESPGAALSQLLASVPHPASPVVRG